MKATELEINGLRLIQLDVHRDSRGFFVERFNVERFEGIGLPVRFAQDNHSFSAPNVLRGLHMQTDPAQGKLVGVTRGKIWDVAVDLRRGSSTFGKSVGVELNGNDGRLFWIPAGFAHGFCVVGGEPADVFYKVDVPYNRDGEIGIRFDDPELAIPWPLTTPILSERDRDLPGLAELRDRL